MATTVDVIINVKDGELQGLNSELNKVAGSLDKVDKEAKQASKSVDDVAGNGGAIAILDQLTGGLATRLRDAYEASKLFNTSLKATRTALIATGVGAFVVALGLIIDNWAQIKNFVTGTTEALERQATTLEQTLATLEGERSIIEKQLELAKLQGASNEELQKQKIALLEQEKATNDELIRKLELQLDSLKSLNREVTTWERIKIGIIGVFNQGEALAQQALARSEQSEETLELEERIRKAKERQIDTEIALFNARNTGTRDGSGDGSGVVRGDLSQVSALDSEGAVESPEVIAAMNVAEQIKGIEDNLAAYKEQKRQEELLQEQILNDQKLALTQQTLGAIIQILGQNSAAGKAAAIAQAIINTYQGITEVWSSESILPEPLATAQRLVSTATVLGSGLQAVQAIKSTQLPAFASGGGNVGGGVQAPAFNVVGASPVNQLAETLSNQNEPIRAYVVGSDVSTQQSLDRNITETATIG